MNTVTLIGRISKDTDLRYSQSGSAVCRMTIAVDRPAKEGEEKKADFIQVTSFGRTAENCHKYLAKGRQVAVLGRIQTGSYTNRDGQKVYTTDVIADRVEFIGSAQHQEAPKYKPQPKQEEYVQESLYDDYDDLPEEFEHTMEDIPF